MSSRPSSKSDTTAALAGAHVREAPDVDVPALLIEPVDPLEPVEFDELPDELPPPVPLEPAVLLEPLTPELLEPPWFPPLELPPAEFPEFPEPLLPPLFWPWPVDELPPKPPPPVLEFSDSLPPPVLPAVWLLAHPANAGKTSADAKIQDRKIERRMDQASCFGKTCTLP
jgi:hypothetical protein